MASAERRAVTAAGDVLARAKRTARGLVELALPAGCGACNVNSPQAGGLCEACSRALLSLVSLAYCPRCGASLGEGIPRREDGCWACPHPLPRFAGVIRLGPYAPPLRPCVHQLKYRRVEQTLGHLARLLSEAVTAGLEGERVDLILPVPMHWRRRWSRGYDHARALAKGLGRRLDLPVGDELIRVRHTPPQVNLPRTRRIRMIRGAFAVRPRGKLAGARILLVDDVTTTGATANEAARTLLRAKALRVTLAVLAKAEPPAAYAHHARL
jgi:ComF family protein